MTYIEPGTWEEYSDTCYRILYEQGKISIIKINKFEDNTRWSTPLTEGHYLTSAKFECYADGVHYLRRFLSYETNEPTLLNLLTSIKEFISKEPFPLTNCLDYIEV